MGIPRAVSGPSLQLVVDAAMASGDRAVPKVAEENRSAAGLSAADARAILGDAVASALQGGRAAILTPDRRHRLLSLAERIGVRAFDANLVIAVVQDRARRGEDWREWIGGSGANREAVVQETIVTGQSNQVGRWIIAVLLATVLAAALIRWITSG